MKCFFHEALGFFGYTAKKCIIDNTNLVVLYGTGEQAMFHAEMIAFGGRYGFVWKAHRIRQSNRKEGKESNFLTLETNFFVSDKTTTPTVDVPDMASFIPHQVLWMEGKQRCIRIKMTN